MATLGLIPTLVPWIESAEGVPERIKAAACAACGLFLVIVFRTYGVFFVLMLAVLRPRAPGKT